MIAAIENAILARLKAAETALGYKWRALESYPEEDFQGYLDNLVVLEAPAAWVAFGGLPQIENAGGIDRADAVFVVVVAAENLRNEKAQRHGAAGKVGSYQLATDVLAVLGGSDLGLDIDALQADSLRAITPTPATRKRKLSLYAAVFRTRLTLPREQPELAEPGLGDFDVFHANWDLPPFGGVDGDPEAEGVQLPADATADLSDQLIVNPEED